MGIKIVSQGENPECLSRFIHKKTDSIGTIYPKYLLIDIILKFGITSIAIN